MILNTKLSLGKPREKPDTEEIKIYIDYIGEDGYVYKYSPSLKKYIKSEICVIGPKGNPGPKGEDGKVDYNRLKREIDLDKYATIEYVTTEITTLIGGAPDTLDTLKEIADYIESHGNDFADLIGRVDDLEDCCEEVNNTLTTINNNISDLQTNKADKTQLNNYVLKSGDTMTGTLNFSTNNAISIQNTQAVACAGGRMSFGNVYNPTQIRSNDHINIKTGNNNWTVWDSGNFNPEELRQIIIDNELTTSAAFNDLRRIIEENELIVSSALNDLQERTEAAAPQSTTYTKTEVDTLLQNVDIDVDSALSTTSENPVQNKVVTAALATKQDSSQIATINGSRIDQGGNVTIVAAEGQTITIDAVPTAGSENAASSGGVKFDELAIGQRVDTPCFIANGAWQITAQGAIFAIPPGSAIHFSISAAAYYTMLNSLTGIGGSNTFVFATGYTDRVLIGGQGQKEIDVTAPDDAHYVFVNRYNFVGLTVNGIDVWNKGINLRMYDVESKTENVISENDLTIQMGENLADKSTITNVAVFAYGAIATSADWAAVLIDVSNIPAGTVLSFGGIKLGRSGWLRFEDANGTKINEDPQAGYEYLFTDPNGRTNPKTVTVPANAAVLRLDVKSSSSPENPYGDLMVNVGSTLLPYKPYTLYVTAIKGYEIEGSGSGGGIQLIESGAIVDLPVSADGSGIAQGYAYINSTTGVVTVKMS